MSNGKGSKQRPRFIPLHEWAEKWKQTFERGEKDERPSYLVGEVICVECGTINAHLGFPRRGVSYTGDSLTPACPYCERELADATRKTPESFPSSNDCILQ